MARMFRVLGFFALMIGLMGFAGELYDFALLFFAQAVAFVFLGYLKFTEKTYIVLFWGYMAIAFIGFTYWSVFKMGIPY